MTEYKYLAFLPNEDQPFAGNKTLRGLKEEIKSPKSGREIGELKNVWSTSWFYTKVST